MDRTTRFARPYLASALLLLAACATPGAPSAPGTPVEVPHFSADDPRVQSAGFFGQTLRLAREEGDTRYLLMAFRVGDTVTLGAMVEGSFAGEATWSIGEARLTTALRTDPTTEEVGHGAPGPESPIEVEDGPPDAPDLVGQRGAFRGFTWINVDLEASVWMPTSPGRVRLTFRSDDGDVWHLPETGGEYEVTFAAK